MRGVKSGLIRRKKKSAVNVKTKTMICPTNRSKNIGRFVGPATKSSKIKMVLTARTTMKIMKAASFFNESNMPAKGILPLP